MEWNFRLDAIGQKRWVLGCSAWVVTRFSPHFKLFELLATSVPHLEKARETAIPHGLKHIYLRHVPGHLSESTYCPGRGRPFIKRLNYQILEYQMTGMPCRF